MNPRVVLSLWRERWGKPSAAALQVPYVQGKVGQWGKQLAQASVWTHPAGVAIVLACGVPLLALIISVRFSLQDQLLVSGVLIAIALFLRRYAGMLSTLVLAGLALTVTSRYLAWRIGDTLPAGGLGVLLGWSLLAAELYITSRLATGFLRVVWPLVRQPVAIPGERALWPTVDIALDCRGQAPDAVQAAAMRVRAFAWPTKKLKLHLLDDRHREELLALAQSSGAVYLAPATGTDVGALAQMLSANGSELIMLAGCDIDAGSDFLQTVCAWFLRDPLLGMLHTPHHFLATASLEQSTRLFDQSRSPGSCAILRRLALAGADAQEPVSSITTALKSRGYKTAHIGYPAMASAAQLIRVDDPYSAQALRWKLRIAALNDMLRAHETLPRIFFIATPAACLLLGIDLFRTTPQLLAAYALPHLVHAHILQARLQGERRLAAFADVRETLLSYYLLVPTTFNLLRTRLRDAFHRLRNRQESEQPVPFDRKLAASHGLLAAFNLAALGVGLAQLGTVSGNAHARIIFYLGWCAANLLLVASTLAVSQEARQIRQQIRRRAAMPAMLKLPLGRTIACTTIDFPAPTLSLRLPAPVALDPGAEIGVSIFYGEHEFAFPARVANIDQRMLSADIDADAHPSYLSLAAAVLSRGPSWPQWLAGPNADQVLPRSLRKGVIKLLIGILDFATNFGQHMQRMRLGNWILFWKNRK